MHLVPLNPTDIRNRVLGNILSDELTDSHPQPTDSGFLALYKDDIAVRSGSYAGPQVMHFKVVGNKILFLHTTDGQGKEIEFGYAFYHDGGGAIFFRLIMDGKEAQPVRVRLSQAPPRADELHPARGVK